MARPPVTVAALVGADPHVTRGFLALLAQTLAPGDDVALVGADHDPGSPEAWRIRAATELVEPSTAPAVHQLVVVADERAVPTGPWLDPLVAALEDPAVAAAAARTNIADGDELLVGVPYRPNEPTVHRAWVRRLAGERTTVRTPVEWLSGPSLAVRRGSVDAAGGLGVLLGPDPVAVLAREAARRGMLVVAEGSYLHHGGGPAPRTVDPGSGPYPFVSACLITKDEHRNLPRCLASIEGFADEIVVYDTGSTDDTRDIARAHGATVVEGHWDDDFARARNEALARCRGQWVLWIDADEALVCEDPAGSRHLLARLSADVEALIVLIDNLRGTRASTVLTHPACRIFRRAYGHWSGRLHEQVTARAGTPALGMLRVQEPRMTHWGYLEASIGERDKGSRNVRNALGDLTGEGELPWAMRLMSLGRSYGLAGRPAEALPLCRAAVEAADRPSTRRLALRSTIANLLALDRAEEALSEVERLRSMSTHPMLADTLEGRVLLELGRHEEALAVLDRVTDGLDDDGYEHSRDGVAAQKAVALVALERHGEAADVLLGGIRSGGGMDLHVGFLVECLERAGRSLSQLADAVPADRAVAFLGQLVNLDPTLADRILDTWYRDRPSPAVLATATRLAPGLPVDRLRAWSERLRAVGLGRACPLVFAASDGTRLLADRLLAAAVAAEAFGDARGRFAFTALALRLAGAQLADARRQVASSAPALLDVLDTVAGPGAPAVTIAEPSGTGPGSRAAAGEPAAGGPIRSVLVVDRHPQLRTLALAASSRRAGHDVTVLHSEPVAPTEELLAPLGVTVGGWADRPGEHAGWTRALAGALALRGAEHRFDTVILAPSLTEAASQVRRLFPAAQLVVDLDDAPGDLGVGALAVGDQPPDLVLSSVPLVPTVVGAPVTVFPVSVDDVFAPGRPVPEPLRTGICVVGDFGGAREDELARFERVAAELGGRAASVPMALLGSDLDDRAATALPQALRLGPIADPLPWLRAARVVLVATGRGAAHWLAAAASCGTPALVVPAGTDALAQVAPAVGALADPTLTELWEQFAPPAGTPTDSGRGVSPSPSDPLALLPPPCRREGMAPRGRRAVRWVGDDGRCPTVQLAEATPRGLGAAGRRGPTVEVRRSWPPDLSLSSADHLVVEIGWPYGALPAEWLGPLRDVVDELWVPTGWHRDRAMESGAPADRCHVVPYGVDPEPFFPDGGRWRPTREQCTRLLFVGRPIEDDGLDALLETYLTAFSAREDVCLVVRLVDDAGADPGETGLLEELVRRAAERPGTDRPRVELVTGPLSASERADLYRSCDLLVLPHRAPVDLTDGLEAMAAGLPAVVPDGGPWRHLCDARTGWLVGCRHVAVSPDELGLTPPPGGFWRLEPDRASLAEVLRKTTGSPEQRLLKGLVARDRVAARSTVEHTAAAVASRLAALSAGAGAPASGRSPTQDRAPAGR